ncbi:MAG: cytochrome ubiquinol oxidase subunit I [Pseudomonadota bacterium]
MNYPVWQLDFAGGGLFIALIAVLHVYISHFAVGGGLFLVLTEMKGYRENSSEIVDYVKKHTKFFLLMTMVLGGLTGVGIWFTISILSPAGTSVLIHNFVFAWAIEWVFFLVEIISLIIYYYYFGRMSRRNHLILGWIYFISAWLSLFAINGIITFMLTPGTWLETGNFWAGLFNPTFWPSLFLRTFLALMLAGLYGFVTATAIRDKRLRNSMVRYCALWLLLPFALFLSSAWWYRSALPEPMQTLIFQKMAELTPFIKAFYRLSPVVFLGGLLMAINLPRKVTRPLAFLMLFIGLMYMGSFEFIREGGRRPYIIRDYMYSTSLRKAEAAQITQDGLLKNSRWTRHKEITDENRLDAGEEIFTLLCLPCHSIGGPLNDILPLTEKFPVFGMDAMINGIGKFSTHMPQFAGNPQERLAVAHFIIERLHGKKETRQPLVLQEQPVNIPPFDIDNDKYVLLAWNNLGMHCISDSSDFWSLLPPANDIYAQLIRRGETPEVITDKVTLTYRVEPGFENPADHVSFWKTAPAIFGKKLPRNIGLSGNGLSGEMQSHDGVYIADLIPVVPYPDGGGFMPYPLFTIEARDNDTGELLAATKVVAPTSTEMGCRNCHGGEWRVDGRAGFSATTARDILATHDKLSGTDLLTLAEEGTPMLCQNCHADPVLNAEGGPSVLALPAAIHGFHANYLTGRGAEACAACHPASPTGATRCSRGIHDTKHQDCTHCHGTLEDHALSLLKAEHLAGKSKAAVLMKHLTPRMVSSIVNVNPRTPWLNEPDCMTCHVAYEKPVVVSSYNVWTKSGADLYRNRKDDSGSIYCAACHGSPHAIYPSENPYGQNRDVIQPMQYQNMPYSIGANKGCRVCHTVDMTEDFHHAHTLGMVRNP